MTIEKVCFVKPEDIKAIRIECGKCGAANIIPLNSSAGVDTLLTSKCHHCMADSGLKIGTKALEDVMVFSDLLTKLNGHLQGMNIRYSLQIECQQ